MPNTQQNGTKLAPIFDIKSNKTKSKVSDKSDGNKRKRKKKSPKNVKNKKINVKSDNKSDNSSDNESEGMYESRRSKRLLKQLVENETKVNYNEDTDEEFVYEQNENSDESPDKINVRFVLREENSNTIDYWSDHKPIECPQSDSADDDIEIIPTESQQTSQERVQTSSSSQFSEEPKERLLWTEKYKPTNSSEVFGHKIAVNRLKSWLEDWGKGIPKKDKVETDDEDSGYSLDETNACLLICGPTGSGKTSMVYAIAEELKYEILELNASMKRNGREISKILGEATQSHQMQRNNDSKTASIHSFFTSVANNGINRVDKDFKSVKQNKKVKRNGILNYFSLNSVKNSSKTSEIEIIDEEVVEKTETQSKNNSVLNKREKSSNDCPVFTPKALSIASNSLILFDDIDVMIDDDFNGFWNAFNRINESTKKPVILTATQYVPYIKSCVNRLQTLTLNKPNPSETIEGLKRICEKELPVLEDDRDTNSESVCKYLSSSYDYDIRRCLNQLQFGTDWQHIQTKDQQIKDKKPDITSYYDSLLFEDIMEKQFGILSEFDNRDNWMKSKTTLMENETHTIVLAKDIIESVNDLNHNIIKRNEKLKELPKLIDNETIECVSQYLSPNTNLRTILLDYCPYLSFICDSESIRQSQTANHSRRSRRFLHHLDSIGFYIDNVIKTKLISAFVSQNSENILENNSEESNSGHKLDEYFYE